MPHVFRCPHCGHARSYAVRRFHRKCKQCRREWSTGSQYPVDGFRLTRREWKQVIEVFLRDGTARAIPRERGLSWPTAQRCATTIREVMSADVPTIFRGICESDETYIGGLRRNKKLHIRAKPSKRGRGTLKQAIFGVYERDRGMVVSWLVPNIKMSTTLPYILDTVESGSTIYTDDFPGYRQLPSHGYCHDFVKHSEGEYVRGEVHTQNLDGYWGQLKKFLANRGGIQRQYLYRFVGEHNWRYNFRNLTRREQVKRIYSFLTRFGGRK